jgi:hypothetical protein
MGGPGSGNSYHWWRSGKKTTVAECLGIGANHWMREGILKADHNLSGTWRWTYPSGSSVCMSYDVQTLDMQRPSVRLIYSWTWNGDDHPQSVDYEVPLETTFLHFGGVRWWFLCPLAVRGTQPCNRRVGKLYLPRSGRYFGCRRCYDLTYASCQESHKYDSLYRSMARNTGYDFLTVKKAMNSIGKRQ